MEAKGDDPDPATPTTASLLTLVRDAATTDELTTRLASLAAAIAGFQITVAKAEVLAAAKAKRAALGAGGWTKECAVALKGVLQAFGKGISSVTAVAELGTGRWEMRERESAREREKARESLKERACLPLCVFAICHEVLYRRGWCRAGLILVVVYGGARCR
jgi:hypothetical protein